MSVASQIARQMRELHTGGNMAGSDLQQKIADITWEQAIAKVHGLNSIALLTYHVNYYVAGLIDVMEGGPLTIRDMYSYDMPPVTGPEDWERLRTKTLADAETFARLVEQMPDSRLYESFIDGKYGTWYRNLTGVLEHTHYHLGQIAIIKKMVLHG